MFVFLYFLTTHSLREETGSTTPVSIHRVNAEEDLNCVQGKHIFIMVSEVLRSNKDKSSILMIS